MVIHASSGRLNRRLKVICLVENVRACRSGDQSESHHPHRRDTPGTTTGPLFGRTEQHSPLAFVHLCVPAQCWKAPVVLVEHCRTQNRTYYCPISGILPIIPQPQIPCCRPAGSWPWLCLLHVQYSEEACLDCPLHFDRRWPDRESLESTLSTASRHRSPIANPQTR